MVIPLYNAEQIHHVCHLLSSSLISLQCTHLVIYVFLLCLLPTFHLYTRENIFFLFFPFPLTYILRRYGHEYIYLLLVYDNSTNNSLLLLSAVNISLARMYAKRLIFSSTASVPLLIYLYTVIIVRLDIHWYQNITHNSHIYRFYIGFCTFFSIVCFVT